MEFVGEILNHKEYRQRVKQYAKEKIVHSYFMALKTDEILDATCRGNLSRFINHSCNPNCETQKVKHFTLIYFFFYLAFTLFYLFINRIFYLFIDFLCFCCIH